MDFEESLPSQSTFLKPGGKSAHQQFQASSYLDDAEDDMRASSPPPPPPPPHEFQPDQTANNDVRAPPTASATGKFPFLRKNSRKEPSALHRVNSPSTSPTGRPSSTPSPPALTNSSSAHREVDYLEHGIGGKPQGMNSGANSGTMRGTAANNNTYRSVDGFAETADYSTVSIAGDHWLQQQRSAVDELQEFELIEQQLEYSGSFKPTASATIGFGAVASSRRGTGTKLDDSHVTEESEGWDEAYDVERSTSRGGGTASRPQPVPIGKSPTVAEQYDDDFEGDETYDRSRDATYGNEREFAQDDSNEYDVEYNDFGSPDTTTPAPAAIRPRSGSPNAGANVRPSATSTQPAAARASESPSWGRVTQPVENSYNSGDDHSDGPLSSASRGNESAALGKSARLSDSTLRKISSRTAALHQSSRPTLERPVLADDTSGAHDDREDDASARDAQSRGVVYTRPLSSQRRLANTLAAPSSTIQGKPRSGSTGRLSQASRPASGANVTASDYISDKAKELEAELQTYRSENATLKKLRKQQEQALAEVVSQKEEVLKWAAEEKMRTAKWCDEQQQLAVRERNAAAKMARDTRQKALGGTVPIRKEKAEIEALQATVEKMKVDHEQAAKKWKLTENRLYGLIKDHTTHIEEAEKQLLALEHEKIQLLEFISGQGLLLPKNLRSALQRTPLYRAPSNSDVTTGAAAGSAGGKASARGSVGAQDALRGKTAGASARKAYGDEGYVEEVDVDVVDASTSRYTADAQVFASTSGALGPPKKSAVKPTASPKSGTRGALTNQTGDFSSRPTSSTQRASSAPRGGARPGSSSLARTDVLPGASSSNRESWARSSRSSGGRYDDCEASDRDDPLYEPDSFRAYETMAQQRASTAGDAVSSKHTASTTSHAHPTGHDHTPATAAAGRMEEDLPGGGKVIRYKNGTVKEVDKEGNSTVRFLNGDTKTVNTLNGTIVYFYAEAATTHTTFKDGLEVYEFPNKQVEMHFPDGVKEIIFPDGTRKVINPDGLQESHFPDGVILWEHPDGRKEVLSNDSL